ncbi:MAG TPA: dihydrofolate reductase [Bacilli bacterium]|nr:dihydrofolate reductase [Bacilli bacterium]
MTISLIVAMDENRLIGQDNRLPWHLPNDLQYFKKVTMGKPVIMGRKTFESIGRPLPGRRNIILTRQQGYRVEGCEVIHSLEELKAYQHTSDEVFCIGGAEIFHEILPYADRLYITRIYASFEGDAYFPEIDESQWKVVSSEEGATDEKNREAHTFFVYERIH